MKYDASARYSSVLLGILASFFSFQGIKIAGNLFVVARLGEICRY